MDVFELDPAFPSDGDWGCPVWTFPEQGPFREGHPTIGPHAVLRFGHGPARWVGFFQQGYWSRLAVFPLGASALFVHSGGVGFIVHPERPDATERFDAVYPIGRVIPLEEDVVVWSFTNLARISGSGPCWVSHRVCLDDLEVLDVSRDEIRCRGDMLPTSEFTVSAIDGQQLSGRVWPGIPID